MVRCYPTNIDPVESDSGAKLGEEATHTKRGSGSSDGSLPSRQVCFASRDRARNGRNEEGRLKAFLFDRISDDVQRGGLSHSMQFESGTKYAAAMGLKIVRVFDIVETGWSAGHRRKFNAMLDEAENTGVRHIIFKNVDRCARNFTDFVRMENLFMNKGFTFHFYETRLVLSSQSNYRDKHAFADEMALAKRLSDKLSEDVKNVHRRKRLEGIPQTIPWGYKWEPESRTVGIDVEKRDYVRFFFKEFLKGKQTLRSMAVLMNSKGIAAPKGGKWNEENAESVRAILSNTFYYGELSTSSGETYPGKHKCYITRHQYARIQEILSAKAPRLAGKFTTKRKFLLSSLLRCACGRTLYGDAKQIKTSGGKTKPVVYYVHRCGNAGRQVSIQERNLLLLLDGQMRSLPIGRHFDENLQYMFRRTLEELEATSFKAHARIQGRIANITRNLSTLMEVFLSGQIDADIVQAKISEKKKERAHLIEQLNEIGTDHSSMMETVLEYARTLRQAPEVYAEAAPADRVLILREFFESFTITNGMLTPIWRKPYSFLMTDAVIRMTSPPGKAGVLTTLLPRGNKLRTLMEDTVTAFSVGGGAEIKRKSRSATPE
jgi:DNA invertase Pin-like site-specific DNA recombinase